MRSINLKIIIVYSIFIIITVFLLSFLIFENQSDIIADYSYFRSNLEAEKLLKRVNNLAASLNNCENCNFDSILLNLIDNVRVVSDSFFILDTDGKIYFDPRNGLQITEDHVLNSIRAIYNRKIFDQFFFIKLNQKSYMISYYIPLVDFKGYDDKILIVNYKFEELKEYKVLLHKILLILSIIIIFLYICLAFINHAIIIRPIKKLHRTSLDIIRGNLEGRIEIKNKDEIGQLARVFNIMVYSLHRKILDLKNKNNIIEKELEMASNVQKAIYPDIRETNLFTLNVYHKPLSKVSGDFHDIVKLNENKYGILIADVSGHGVPAALITMIIKNLFIYNSKYYNDPKEMITFYNNELCNLMSHYDSFVTAFYGIVTENKFLYTSALHPDSYFISKEKNEIIELSSEGYLIGVSTNANKLFITEEIDISKGDKIILFSDGISEAMNENKQRFHDVVLPDLLKTYRDLNAHELRQKIINYKKQFSAKIIDDETLIIIEIK